MNDQLDYSQNKNNRRNQRRQSDFYPADNRYPIDDRYPSDDSDRYDDSYPEDDQYEDGYRYDEPYSDSTNYDGYDNSDYDNRYDDKYNERYSSRGYIDSYYDEPRREPSRRQVRNQPSRERESYYPSEQPRRQATTRERYLDDDHNNYRAGYRDAIRDQSEERNDRYSESNNNGNNKHTKMSNNNESFRKRHPIIMHLIYACLATFLAIWMALWFLDYWTFHGQERAVPDVKGQSYETALGNISRAGLRAIVTDSIYDNYARPGSVVDQTPIPLAKIKRGGTVYLTLVAYTPKMVTIPDFYDISERQARSMLEGLGITQIKTIQVPSEYEGLVLGTRYNGVTLRPGAKVPITAVITLEVGKGMADETNEVIDQSAIEDAIETLNIEQ